ncbi:hypothetical protein DFH27DRAFT_388299 [Peziza echinospora]|nr:hypothetical protein DFH27DRAFT_388299 [Peziza echinospora]
MQFTNAILATTLLLLPSTISAWKMSVNYADGGQLPIKGHHNSGCTKFKKTDSPITSVYFEKSLSADTFVLYVDDHCKEESYKGHKGHNNIPNKEYKSYKVY